MDKSTRRLPPGPKGHFLLGNLPEFGKDLLGFITQCARVWGYREAAACQPRGLSPESPRLHGVRPRHESPQLRQELVLLAPRESGVWERPPHERRGFLAARLGEAAPQVRILPLRGRPSHLYRWRLRHDGDGPPPGHHCSAIPADAGARPPDCAVPFDYLTTRVRSASNARAATVSPSAPGSPQTEARRGDVPWSGSRTAVIR